MKKISILIIGLVALSVLTGSNALGNISDGLVAYYPFDGDANDYSGSGHHGNEHGGLGYSAGMFGSALELDGVDDYVSVPDAQDLRMQDNFSFSAWVQTDEVDWQYIAHKMGDSDGANYTIVLWDNEIPEYNTLGGHFENAADSDWWFGQDVSQQVIIHTNTWYHLAFTKEADLFKLYVDGALVESQTYSFTEVTGAYDLLIGVSDHYEHNWNGQIDEFRIYDRAISVAEVGQLAAIPEPSSAILIACIGAFGVFVRRRFQLT